MTVPTPQDPARSAERTEQGWSAGDCGGTGTSMEPLRDECAEGDGWMDGWFDGIVGMAG